jgi:hypothetical protein
MHTMSDFRVLSKTASLTRRISRRELSQTLLTGFAAGLFLPLASAAHPLHKHLLKDSLLDFADNRLSSETTKPLFLSTQQLATLDVLSEAIVPGSRKAQAALFIDLLLSADTHKVQQTFVDALSAIETVSNSTFHAAIIELSPGQLHDLLTTVSTQDSANDKQFNQLKDWISGAYYSSEIGMRELGWTPDRVFSTFPGCSHSDGHA